MHRVHVSAKTWHRAGFWHHLSSAVPFLWEQQPVSASGEAQLPCVMGRACARYEEGTPLQIYVLVRCRIAGEHDASVPRALLPQLWVAEWQQ